MREKGVDELLSAMRRLTGEGVPCTLDMVGGYEEDYGAVVEEAESEGWLKYWGYQEDVRPFIAAAHCFVLPSWHEGMANTNLECAASGRPVITSRHSRLHGSSGGRRDRLPVRKKGLGQPLRGNEAVLRPVHGGEKSHGLSGQETYGSRV